MIETEKYIFHRALRNMNNAAGNCGTLETETTEIFIIRAVTNLCGQKICQF